MEQGTGLRAVSLRSISAPPGVPALLRIGRMMTHHPQMGDVEKFSIYHGEYEQNQLLRNLRLQK
jgi:hypothetical protein